MGVIRFEAETTARPGETFASFKNGDLDGCLLHSNNSRSYLVAHDMSGHRMLVCLGGSVGCPDNGCVGFVIKNPEDLFEREMLVQLRGRNVLVSE